MRPGQRLCVSFVLAGEALAGYENAMKIEEDPMEVEKFIKLLSIRRPDSHLSKKEYLLWMSSLKEGPMSPRTVKDIAMWDQNCVNECF